MYNVAHLSPGMMGWIVRTTGIQDAVFAQNLDTWAQQGHGGVIGVGWALFGSLDEKATVSAGVR